MTDGTAVVAKIALTAADGASALGITKKQFAELIQLGHMPAPRVLGARQHWSASEIDAAFSRLLHAGDIDPHAAYKNPRV